MPGEVTEIVLRPIMTKSTVSRLNQGPRKLEDTLVFHTMFGRDIFIVVTAEYGL